MLRVRPVFSVVCVVGVRFWPWMASFCAVECLMDELAEFFGPMNFYKTHYFQCCFDTSPISKGLDSLLMTFSICTAK